MKKPDPLLRKMFERTIRNQGRPVTARFQPKKKPGDQATDDNAGIDCRKCTHFSITWKKSTPYSCGAHGFMSAQLPSHVVFSSSGEHCMYFTLKE